MAFLHTERGQNLWFTSNSTYQRSENRLRCCFLRGIGQGKVYKIEGLNEAQKKMGSLVVDVSLPQMGQPKSSTYEGEGWVIIQGQNTEKVKMAALELIRTVRIHYR